MDPKNITSSAQKYMAMVPMFREEKTQKITALALTLLALSFLGIFAIRPSLSTVSELKKELADDTTVENSLEEKIANLSLLQQQYYRIEPDLPVVYAAVPQTPLAPILMGQLHALALGNHLAIIRSEVFQVQLSKKASGADQNTSSFAFTLETEGSDGDSRQFLTQLSQFDRIVLFDTVSIGAKENSTATSLTIRGKAFFKE